MTASQDPPRRLDDPCLETPRLHLRVLTIDDAPAVHTHFSDADVTRFMDIEPCRDLAEAQEIIRHHRDDTGCRWGLFDKSTGELLGTCGYHCWSQGSDASAEIGYDLGRASWGSGLAREAVRAVLRFGFDVMHLSRIDAEVEPANERSIVLLEKLGFTREPEHRQGQLRFHLLPTE
jgi:ribosomal-protein-alanine N-acetyltransferase